ncbi:hypothetical protein B0J18DRAFT_40364 [Chaetomium sp. MPI-SDFR-AT-0129]|nr:hypothetical protein B0J18DRAFT_40364 [Chaetomium sp. MPI-SDFR-AT-0129]
MGEKPTSSFRWERSLPPFLSIYFTSTGGVLAVHSMLSNTFFSSSWSHGLHSAAFSSVGSPQFELVLCGVVHEAGLCLFNLFSLSTSRHCPLSWLLNFWILVGSGHCVGVGEAYPFFDFFPPPGFLPWGCLRRRVDVMRGGSDLLKRRHRGSGRVWMGRIDTGL